MDGKLLPLAGAAMMTLPAMAYEKVDNSEMSGTKPNFVFIFADDLGWRDTGFNGSKYYETPNLDKLAQQGMVFSNAYANAANCAPSRACLLTGQYTPRHELYAVFTINRGKKSTDRLSLKNVNERNFVPAQKVTFAEALKTAGYTTACIGKWHVGHEPQHMPDKQGFDFVIDDAKKHKFKQTNDPKSIYRFTRSACEFMEENKEKPFMLYLPHHAVHTAIEARKELVDKYKGKKAVDGQKHAAYAAMVEHTDDSVGMIMKKLKDLGIEDNTFVLFFSDNGGMPFTPQTPLRGHKGMYYEGGIREPMVVRWPGKVKAGSICDTPVSSVDFYTTFLDLAGAAKPLNHPLDGESIVPLLQEKQTERKPVFWHFPGYLAGKWPGSRVPAYRSQPVSVIRKGDWKLHLFMEEWALDGGMDKIDNNNAVELYNIKEDIGESKNLALENKAKRDELLKDLLAWHKSVNAPMPKEPNPNFGKSVSKKPKKKKAKKKI